MKDTGTRFGMAAVGLKAIGKVCQKKALSNEATVADYRTDEPSRQRQKEKTKVKNP
ncbi:MAG: hypothetical protein AAGL08_17035 [Cyanobacteria bacterium J06573_11]